MFRAHSFYKPKVPSEYKSGPPSSVRHGFLHSGLLGGPNKKDWPYKSAPSKLQPLAGLGTQAFWMVGPPDERPTCNAAPTLYPPCPFSLLDYEALPRPSSIGQGQGTCSSWKPTPSHPTPTPPFTTPARSPHE